MAGSRRALVCALFTVLVVAGAPADVSVAGLRVAPLEAPAPGKVWPLQIEILPADSLSAGRLVISSRSAGALDGERPLGEMPAGAAIIDRLDVSIPVSGSAVVSLDLFANRVDGCGGVSDIHENANLFIESDGLRVGVSSSSARGARLDLALQAEDLDDAGREALADEAMLEASSAARVSELAIKRATEQSADSVTFQLVWRDPVGGLHPARRCSARLIQVMYDKVRGLEVPIQVDNRSLDDDGRVTLRARSISYMEFRRYRISVEAENNGARVILPPTGFSVPVDCLLGGVTYRFLREAVTLADLERTYALESNDALHGAFSVADAVIGPAQWVGGASQATILFPTEGLPQTEQFTRCIGIPSRSAFSWDVIHHEYGHYLNLQREFVSTIGLFDPRNDACLTHAICRSVYPQCPYYSTAAITALSEGFANWFAIAAQLEAPELMSEMPFTRDTCVANDVFPNCIDLAFRRGCTSEPIGETAEINVSRVLYGLGLSLGGRDLLYRLAATEPGSLVEVWDALTRDARVGEKLTLAKLFVDNRVAPAPLTPVDGFEINASAPLAFTWEKNGLDQFRIRFYDSQQVEIPGSLIEVAGDVDRWEVTAEQMSRLVVGCGANFWVVEGRHSESASDAWYWSTPQRLGGGVDFCFVIDDTGSMSDEITSVRDGIQNFLATFDAASDATAFQLITFKDDVTAHPPTCDLATIQSQVAELVAEGGGDCPENSVEALELGGVVTKRGGVIFLATDADPHSGADLDGLIGQLQAAGARVQIVLRGSCSGEGTGGGSTAKSSVQSATAGQPGAKQALQQATRYANAIDAYARIASATGGSFAFIPESSPQSLTDFQRSIENALVAASGPSVVLLTPRVLRQGAEATLTLAAQNTSFASNSTVAFTNGVQVTGVRRLDPVTLAADVIVPADATLGYADGTVMTPLTSEHLETAVGRGILRIEPAYGAPALVSCDPAVVLQGESVDVRINGQSTSFSAETTLELGDGVTVEALNVLSPTALIATLRIDPDASAGFREVVAYSGPQRARNESAEFLRIWAAPPAAPRIIEVTPAEASPGAVVDLAVTLENVELSAEATSVEITGPGVLSSDALACGGGLVARVTLDCAAPAGARDVIVRSNGRAYAKPNAFIVVGEPCPPVEEAREAPLEETSGLCPAAAPAALALTLGFALLRRRGA